ncbi:MAG: AAA family ATPase [Anaerolineae bacterium]
MRGRRKMYITRVELENIKSYQHEIIELGQGVTAICGENGAGKSTILEAIGFALFDFSPFRRQSQLVREGAGRGTITVAFVASDEREYEVVRTCGKSLEYYVYDPELRVRLREGKAGVQEWLCEQFGVPPDTNLAHLFSNAIGVPQGLLTAAFLEDTSARREKFDRLLRVEEYQRAFEGLREVESMLREHVSALERECAGLEGQLARLPQLEQEAGELDEELENIRQRRAQLQEELAGLQEKWEEFQRQKMMVDSLEQSTNLLVQQLEGLNAQLAQAERRLRDAQEAAETCHRLAPAYQAYREAEEALRELEEERRRRDDTRQKLGEVEKSLAGMEARLESLQAQLAKIDDAVERLKELQPALEQYHHLEQEIQAERQRASLLEQRRQSLGEVTAGLGKLAAQRQALMDELARLQECIPLVEELPLLDQQFAEIQKGHGRLLTQLEQANQSRQAVAGGLCPFLKEPCRNMQEGMSLADYFDRQIAVLEKELQSLTVVQGELGVRLRRAREAAERLAGQEPLKNNLRAVEEQIAELSSRREALEREVASLADSPDRLRMLEEQMRALENLPAEAGRLQTLTEERPAVELERQALGDQVEEARRRQAALQASLAVYGDLDARMAAERRRLEDNADAHREYIRNERIAAQLPEAEADVGQLRQNCQEVEANIARLQGQLAEARRQYDAGAHAQAQEQLETCRAALSSLEERLRLKEERRRVVQEELAQMRGQKAHLEDVLKEMSREKALLEVVKTARTVIRDAGPHITRVLVQAISREAAGIFSRLMNDYTMHLEWDEGYEIQVEKAGHIRTFQQLSGGEQMSAALAVRLALLKELSDLDIAFFDEPTANLDESRRESLADHILNLRGFSQLFVISHDDTFERVTENRIRVVKENGVSRVYSG